MIYQTLQAPEIAFCFVSQCQTYSKVLWTIYRKAVFRSYCMQSINFDTQPNIMHRHGICPIIYTTKIANIFRRDFYIHWPDQLNSFDSYSRPPITLNNCEFVTIPFKSQLIYGGQHSQFFRCCSCFTGHQIWQFIHIYSIFSNFCPPLYLDWHFLGVLWVSVID